MLVRTLISCILLLVPALLTAQDSDNMPVRTPAQEAAHQTEKLRQALDLTEKQEKQIYQINLHYAKQRQTSNSRTEALERVKRKNADLKKVLTDEQYDRLQHKRHYDRTTYRLPDMRQNTVRTSTTTQPANGNSRTAPTSVRTENPRDNNAAENPSLRNDSRQGTENSTPSPRQTDRPTGTTYNIRPTSQPVRKPSVQSNTGTRRSGVYRTPSGTPAYRNRSTLPMNYPGRSYPTTSPQRYNTGNRR